jgi:hypothetical protein
MSARRLLIGISLLAALAPRGADAAACNDASLRGSYGFLAAGDTFAALGLPAPLTGAFASLGTADYDGRGHVSLTAVASFDGVVQRPPAATGTYAVNADCSFTSSLDHGATFLGSIVEGGRELLLLQTTTGTAITGVAQKRSRVRDCTAATIAGSYGFVADGSAGAPTLPATPFGPLAGAGVVTLDGDGSFTMMAQRSVGGAIDPSVLRLTGSFVVNPDCSYALTFDVGFHFEALAIDRGESIFLQTDPGTAVTVRAKRL